MSPSAPLKLAVIGVGRMGSFHVRQLATLPSIEIVAVADAARPSTDALRDVVSDAAAYDDATTAFAHAGVEACLIATPTPTHPDLVRDALAAGLHVLCEKPLSLDPAASESLGELARGAGKILQIGFWRRFSPPWTSARRAIVDDRIGPPLMIRLSQWDADPPPLSFCDPAVSGGLAVDCGVHEFDLAEWLTGCAVERVRAWSLPPVDGGVSAAGDVDNLVAVLELGGGAVATVDLSRNCRYGDDVRTEILGARGAIFVDLLPSGRARIGDASGIRVLDGSLADDATAAGVINQAAAFAAAIRGADVDLPGAAASGRATLVAHAVRQAAETGGAVEIPARREAVHQ